MKQNLPHWLAHLKETNPINENICEPFTVYALMRSS